MAKMLLARRVFLFMFVLQLYLYGEANINEEFQKKIQSLYNFMDELRIASGTLQNFFTQIQAVFCPEQPICSSEGIQDRDLVLNSLPKYLDIGTSSLSVENLSDIVGVCCLPCSCSDTCFAHGYCCLSKLLNISVTEQESSDISTMSSSRREDKMHSVGDISHSLFTDISETTSSLIGTSFERPGKSECVLPSVKSYYREIPESVEIGYFMITSCFGKTTNKALARKCEEPSVDVFDETVPVTSLRTNQTYWNRQCAICNSDGQVTIDWTSTGLFGNTLVFFANTSDIPAFPETSDALHQFILYRGDIIYTPPFPMKDKECSLELYECESDWLVGAKNVLDIPWLLEACKQYTSPIVKQVFFTTKLYKMAPFRNIFCFFCQQSKTGLHKNSRCNLNSAGSRLTSTELKGLINYQPQADRESSTDEQLANGNSLCGEICNTKLDRCRPVLCPPGDFMIGCQCVQMVKNLSGMPILIYLRVVPESDTLPTMTAKQVRSYNTALSKTLQKTIDEITVEPVATFKQETKTGKTFLSLVLVRSNPDHDAKQTMKPFLDYLDSPRKMKMLTGKTLYYVRLTSRVRMWSEWNKTSLTESSKLVDFDLKENDPPLVHSVGSSLTRVYRQNFYQVFSPLLYCRQVLLDKNEFFEHDGNLVVNITSPEIFMPYFYRVGPNKARICAEEFLRKQKDTGTKFGHTASAMVIMFGYVLLC